MCYAFSGLLLGLMTQANLVCFSSYNSDYKSLRKILFYFIQNARKLFILVRAFVIPYGYVLTFVIYLIIYTISKSTSFIVLSFTTTMVQLVNQSTPSSIQSNLNLQCDNGHCGIYVFHCGIYMLGETQPLDYERDSWSNALWRYHKSKQPTYY